MKYVLYDLNIVLVLGHEKALNHPNCILHLHHFIIEQFRNQFRYRLKIKPLIYLSSAVLLLKLNKKSHTMKNDPGPYTFLRVSSLISLYFPKVLTLGFEMINFGNSKSYRYILC